jgi:hypothetical protein
LLPHNLLPSGQYNTPIVSLTETWLSESKLVH